MTKNEKELIGLTGLLLDIIKEIPDYTNINITLDGEERNLGVLLLGGYTTLQSVLNDLTISTTAELAKVNADKSLEKKYVVITRDLNGFHSEDENEYYADRKSAMEAAMDLTTIDRYAELYYTNNDENCPLGDLVFSMYQLHRSLLKKEYGEPITTQEKEDK